MSAAHVTFRTIEALEAVFVDVTEAWGLSASERRTVRDGATPDDAGRRRGTIRSVAERMALVTEIDLLLDARMEPAEARAWIRGGNGTWSAGSPLQDMFGPTAMLRRVRTMLAAGATR